MENNNVEVMAAEQLPQPVAKDLPNQEQELQGKMEQAWEKDYFLTAVADAGTYKDADSVKQVQSYLAEQGHDLGKTGVDGIVGEKTLGAIRKEMFSISGMIEEYQPLVKKESPIDTLTPMSEEEKPFIESLNQAANYLAVDEGYSERLPANVPAYNKPEFDKNGKRNKMSGITIGGLDIKHGNRKVIFKALSKVFPPDVIESLKAVQDLDGKKAQEAFLKLKDKLKLTNEQIGMLQKEYLLNETLTRISEHMPIEKFKQLPTNVQSSIFALSFLNVGPNSLGALSKALDTNNPEDALRNYRNYWKSPTKHNSNRSNRVADAIEKMF